MSVIGTGKKGRNSMKSKTIDEFYEKHVAKSIWMLLLLLFIERDIIASTEPKMGIQRL